MFQFILTTILMASLGTMLYLMARALPRMEEEASDKQNFLDRLSSSEIPEKIDAAFNSFLFKFLRKSKVILLKIENFINEKLKKISHNGDTKNLGGLTANPKPKIDFKDLNGAEKEKSEQVFNGIEKTPDSDNN